jgi:hypothetical protein
LVLPGTTGELGPYLEFYLIRLAERPELNEPYRVHLSESLWTLTHEVGFQLHITPTTLTRMNIQTDLTRRSIHTEKGRKKKNKEEE